jgi:signal transduction histidine kinase
MSTDFKKIADESVDCELWLPLRDGERPWISRAVQDYTGYSAEECLGWADFPLPLIAEQDIGAWQFIRQEALAGRAAHDLNLRLRHRCDYQVPTSLSARLVLDERGEPAGLRLSLRRIEDPTRVDLALRRVIQLTARTGGQAFFEAISLALGQAIAADLFLVGRLLRETHEVRTLSMIIDGKLQENVTYHLADTPCAVVMGQEVCVYADRVADLFPKDVMLRDLGMAGYIGQALYDAQGNPTGILVALYRQPITEPEWAKTMLGLFAPRVGAEIERDETERELRRVNESLEERVEERTHALKQTLDDLKATQENLIQSEKLASLGALVAGIAHELNTPIGNALASVTTLQQQTHGLKREIAEKGGLSRRHFEDYLSSVGEGTDIAQRNLGRAAGLIRSFKEVAVDQSSARRRRFDLAHTVEAVLLTLTPTFKTLQHQVTVDLPPGREMDSVPGALEQVLTNLIDNALKHAFGDGRIGRIHISLASETDKTLTLAVADNGVGISQELLPRVFDPFVSSRFGQGGSGLGLHLVYTLVTGALGGHIELESSQETGTRFLLTLPRVAPAA